MAPPKAVAPAVAAATNGSRDATKVPGLPANYSAAKAALAQCVKIDECKDIADKAQALAIYAKQAKDKTLEYDAARIRARAVRRQGELLKQINKAKNQHDARARVGTHPSRKAVAKEAGLSPEQQKTAIRVANVPQDQFEQQVESHKPPTVQALAKQGVKPGKRFAESTKWLDEVHSALDPKPPPEEPDPERDEPVTKVKSRLKSGHPKLHEVGLALVDIEREPEPEGQQKAAPELKVCCAISVITQLIDQSKPEDRRSIIAELRKELDRQENLISAWERKADAAHDTGGAP